MESAPTLLTLGCRLNAVESEAMRRLAADAGVDDAVIINTCAVTREAERTARRRIRRAKRDNPDARIVVTGCAAQINPHAYSSMDEVDVVLGNEEKLQAETWRDLSSAKTEHVRVNDIMSVRETAGHLIEGYGDRSRAFLQVQNGCDHRCTFCIIPYGRGNSRSVPIALVLEHAHRLVDAGYKELVLTGVDLTSYGVDLDDTPALGDLVAALLDNLDGLFRLRLSSVDGAEIDDRLFERLTGDEKLAPYLHLSLQAGDNLILKRMKRRHDREQAIDLCTKLRERRPGFSFGADFIAGFPTETEAMFRQTLDLVDDAGLQFLHVFPYSPRPDTPAARMPAVPPEIVKERAERLRKKGDDALVAFEESLVGSRQRAIQETGGRARLANFATACFDRGRAGDIVDIRIVERSENGLVAETLR